MTISELKACRQDKTQNGDGSLKLLLLISSIEDTNQSVNYNLTAKHIYTASECELITKLS